MAMQFSGKLLVPLGNDEMATGMNMQIFAGSERGHLAKLTNFDYGRLNPLKRKIEIDFHPIHPEREFEELMYARYGTWDFRTFIWYKEWQ